MAMRKKTLPAAMPSVTVPEILRQVAAGTLPPAEAARLLAQARTYELKDAAVDLDRHTRRGRPEAIFGEGKSPKQIVGMMEALLNAGQGALVTRCAGEAAKAAQRKFKGLHVEWHERARVLSVRLEKPAEGAGLVAVFCAGTTDLPVAEEAAETARFFGARVELAPDVGVAGIHRLFARAELLRNARAVIAVAGMEGALPSVVAGLTPAPVIAVPTAVGYGVSFGGVSALLTMLNSCAPGVSVVNIGNGFGAGYLAAAINAPHWHLEPGERNT